MKKIFTNLFLLATIFMASTNLSAQTYNGGTWYSLYDTGENSNVNAFSPDFAEKSVFAPAESMTFEYKKFSMLSTDGKVEVYNKVNGTDWSSSKGSVSYSDRKNWKTSPTISLDANISHIRYKMASGTGVYVRNHFVKLKKHILIADGGYGKSSESKSFGNVTIGGTSNVQTVNLRSFLTNGDITITSDNSAFRIGSANNTSGQTFAVGANACASANGSGAAGGGNLGAISNYAVNIYFCPTEAKEYSATITISDGTSTAEISVSGVGVKKEQFITWSDKYFDGKLPIGKIVEDAANLTSSLPVVYTSSNDTIIKIINDGAAFQTVGEGTAIITAFHDGNEEWNAVSSEKTFTVTSKKIQSITWSDNLTRLKTTDESITLGAKVQILVNAETGEKEDSPERTVLLTYTSENNNVVSIFDHNKLAINGEGETYLIATVEGDEYFEAASLRVPVRVRVPSAGCEDVLLVNQSGEIEFFQMNTDEITKEAIAINTLAGVPDKLSFQHKGEEWTLVIDYYAGSIKAQQSTNGGNSWSDIAGSEVEPTVGTYNTTTVQLDRNATHIRFVRPSGGQGYHYVSGIVVTPAQYLETSIDNITEDAIVGDVISKDIVINYANVKEEVLIHKTHSNIALSVEGLGNDCGDFGSATLSVTIVPTEVGIIEDEIVVSDTISGMKVIIPVKVNVKRNNQTITWEQDLTNLYTTDVVTLTATANTDIYYTSSDSTIAYAEGNTLVINKHGQVTITAVAVQSEKYEQATSSKEITISLVIPTVTTWPTVEPIAYAQTLTQDMLIGGEAEVEGVFEWNTELNQTLLPGTYDLAVRFVPANSNYYAPVDGTVAVTINKSAQSIVWNDSFDNITVTDSIVLNASAQTTMTYEVSNMELAYITDNNVLYFLHGGTLLITAYAEEDDYYLADALTRELTIFPGKPIIVSYPTATAITYGQTLSESILEGGEASTAGSFEWMDSLALPNAGADWQYVRFVPEDQESFSTVEFQIELVVNKAPQTITWELEVPVIVPMGQSLPLNAVASSGLPITYILDNDLIASIEEGVFTALEIGQVNLTATQDGTYVDEFGDEYANFLPAESVSYLITIVESDINTSIENTHSNQQVTYKRIINGQVVIIRGEQMFNTLGARIN